MAAYADVAVVIDASLTSVAADVARRVVSQAAKRAKRVALIIFGDHYSCPVGPGRKQVEYEVRISRNPTGGSFLEGGDAASRWLQKQFKAIDHEYLDSALECALAAAADLDWRQEAPKLTLLMGSSLPHDSPGSRLPLRTGVVCPKHRCWRMELERLNALPAMAIRAATPLISDPRANDFANLLRLEVWKVLNNGRRPDSLEAGLPAKWAQHIAS